MFKDQPKGLIPAALANMGERFGFYTMMAILTLFLMSKFGMSGEEAGWLYSIFYGAIYILALVGGLIADGTKNYKGTIIAGLVVMSLGYAFLAVPSLIVSKWIALCALLVIAFGNGLFKGNLQALVGQLYDNEKYSKMRDSGFQLFYMFINIGGMFAPFAAVWVRNWFVQSQGYAYNSDLPGLCWQYKNGTMTADVLNGRFSELAKEVSGGVTPEMSTFADKYLDAFNTGFHYAFSVAIAAMLVSLIIFFIYKNILPDKKKVTTQGDKTELSKEEIKQDAKEIKQRLAALFAVFAVVIFFWFSFHQNGLTLTMFAKDYTQLKLFGMDISAEIFQSINPFIVVFLTPIIMMFFASLAKKGKEPSTPRKIGIGMGIAAFAFVIMTVGSIGLPTYSEVETMGGLPFEQRVTPWLLFTTYFILTVAELFISPLGLSFVSKVAPAHLQGLMQGCWLGATAIGNFSLFLGAMMYERISISVTWSVFVIVCAISMCAMFAMVKWLERVAK
ncbi:peptide MFS transporter [Parabacteroides sp. PF5-9]|uniref:peptide MFS transporter n=1 Tax=Parabacteroides sp. PF5-9 TaxID=1742404 RepID=UPI0024746ABE|nr:peptide MFS transporter [Parabacteroides sp. PF5-9]MDH6358592.1 POT family proton-dependent oligopeptide transporter [Parabacteroides sp. PF5-9]